MADTFGLEVRTVWHSINLARCVAAFHVLRIFQSYSRMRSDALNWGDDCRDCSAPCKLRLGLNVVVIQLK